MLKILQLKKQREMLQEQLKQREDSKTTLKQRSEELSAALDEAKTEVELAEVAEAVEKLEAEEKEHEEAVAALEEKVQELDAQIEDLRSKNNAPAGARRTEGVVSMPEEFAYRVRNDVERRERMQKALKHQEVREFFEKVPNLRTVTNTDLLIPQIVIDMITVDMLDVGKIQALVTRQALSGTGRLVLAGDTPEAIWTEMCASISELALDFSALEVDGYKVSGFVPVCNATLEDAFVNLAVHIQQQLTKAIAKAVDVAIINGTGSIGKQPQGIIGKLPTKNKVTTTADFASVIKQLALLPDDVKTLTAVMTRATYYTWFAPQTIAQTSSGQVVMQSAQNDQRLPDGTPVIFVPKSVIADDKMLLGDFSQYFLVQRAGMQLAVSTDVRFIEDQTVFKGTARFDGLPIKNNYWILYTLTAPADGGS